MQNFEDDFLQFLVDAGGDPTPYFSNQLNQSLIATSKKIFFKTNAIYVNSGAENEDLFYRAQKSKIKLIEIWEDQWTHKKNIIASRINTIFGKANRIHGRETGITKLTNDELLDFLAQNHLAVPLKGKYKFGLKYKKKLVSAISFSPPRIFNQSGQSIRSFEILRFCHLNNHLVVGGLSKLINHFISNYKVDHLMTYIDNDWGEGDGFKKIGFNVAERKPKKMFYIHPGTNERRHHLPGELKKNIQASGDKIENSWIGIYNSGSTKMVMSVYRDASK